MPWHLILYHRIKQWFVRPTCPYCGLTCTPQYGHLCEICEETLDAQR
jgi:hypothetical protein